MGLMCKNVPLACMDFQWWNPTRIIFGEGKVQDLANDLDLDWHFEGLDKAVVVTDPGVKKAGLLDRLLEAFKGGGRTVAAVFDQVLEEADTQQVYEIASLMKASGGDFWIALGGGSVMDACKAAAVIASNGGQLEDYEGMYLVETVPQPIVCIPTTAGTGSEVTWGAVIMDRAQKKKLVIGDYKFAPRVAVLDPDLTRTLPPHLVAATGLDALTHAIGGLVSVDRQDFSSAIALRAVEMIADNIEAAYHDNAGNPDARAKMMIAATMSGIAFQTALPGADHGIGHTAGALHPLHHGLAVGIANLHVMAYNLQAVPHIYASVARALGVADTGLSDEALGMKGIERLKDLYRRIDVKRAYKDYGYPSDAAAVEELAEKSLDDPCMAFNPVPVSRCAAYDRLIRDCIGA
jgi:alcohol dehydrogenase class IV